MRGVSLAEIEEVLERDYRTAQRVIRALGQCFPELEKVKDEESDKARWKLPYKPVAPLLTPTAEEMAALSLALDMLGKGAGKDQVEALRCLHAKILALIPDDRSHRLAADEEALLMAQGHAARPGPRQLGSETVDVAISTALKGASQLRILYRGWKDTVARERVVAPHGLLLGARRYLVAVDLGKANGGIQHFRVDAIEEATVLSQSFVRKEGFDLNAHAERCFGSYQQEGGIHNVAWRFALKQSAGPKAFFPSVPDHGARAGWFARRAISSCRPSRDVLAPLYVGRCGGSHFAARTRTHGRGASTLGLSLNALTPFWGRSVSPGPDPDHQP
jgi:predicted DNA-binding transcriptional regulator YafY